MLFLAPKSRLFGVALAVDTVIIKLTILRHFKMGLALVTDSDSDQTVTFIPADSVLRLLVRGRGCWTMGSEWVRVG